MFKKALSATMAGLICFSLVGCANTPVKEDPVETVPQENVVVQEFSPIESLKAVIDTGYESAFDFYESQIINDDTIEVKMSLEGLSSAANAAVNGDEEALKAWNDIRDRLISTSSVLIETAKGMDMGDVHINMNLVSDENHEQSCLLLEDGTVVYDGVLNDGSEKR